MSLNGGTNFDYLHYLGFYGTFEEPDLIKGAISTNVVHQRMTEESSVSLGVIVKQK